MDDSDHTSLPKLRVGATVWLNGVAVTVNAVSAKGGTAHGHHPRVRPRDFFQHIKPSKHHRRVSMRLGALVNGDGVIRISIQQLPPG